MLRSSAGRKPLAGLFGLSVATPHRWIQSVKSNAERQTWIAEGVAKSFRVFIRQIDIAGTLAKLSEANLTIMLDEGVRFHKHWYEQYGERLADVADLVQRFRVRPNATSDPAARLAASVIGHTTA